MTDTTKHEPVFRKEFLIERQGKSFALFAGLLDLAHQQGLRRIETQCCQIASEDNGQTWLFRAVVETDKGTFSGFADANPTNVSRQMLTAACRLCETRAVARALRFATNIGVAAFEELGPDGPATDDEAPSTQHAPPPAPRPQQGPVPNGNRPPPPAQRPDAADYGYASAPVSMTATPAQVRAIYSIARDQHRLSEQDVAERSVSLFGAAPAELTRKQASEFITSLKG